MPNITLVNNLQGASEAKEVPTATYNATGSGLAVVTGVANQTVSTPYTYTTRKINTLIVANVGSADAVVSLEFDPDTSNASDEVIFVNAVTIPVGASLDVLSGPVYVNAGEAIDCFCTGADVNVLVSYEEIVSSSDT
jgi:hypothetical protein